jgi:hypothetical protein
VHPEAVDIEESVFDAGELGEGAGGHTTDSNKQAVCFKWMGSNTLDSTDGK